MNVSFLSPEFLPKMTSQIREEEEHKLASDINIFYGERKITKSSVAEKIIFELICGFG